MSVRLWHTVLAASVALAPVAVAAQSAVPVGPSPAVIAMRDQWLNPAVNSFTFRDTNKVFESRDVPRSGPVWPLVNGRALAMPAHQSGSTTMTYDAWADRTFTNALLVMKDGRIVSEIYRNNSTAASRFIGWSMTKSLTSVMIGCALEEGRIASLDDPITKYLPELAGGGYGGVSIRQVMQMRSGVDYEERYDFANPGTAASNHIAALVRNTARFADAARTLPRLHEPGAVFQYKTIDTAVLGWLIESVSGSSVAAYTEHCVWEPLGAEADGYYIMDGEPGVGREFSGAGFNATLRDYARFGQMALDGGVANGTRIVAADWIAQSTTPSGAEDQRRGGYGLQWWTIGDSNAFSAIGLQGQYIYIDPDTRTVVVKLSYFPPGDNSALDAETQAFMAAASAWNPR